MTICSHTPETSRASIPLAALLPDFLIRWNPGREAWTFEDRLILAYRPALLSAPDKDGRPDIHLVHTLIAPLDVAGRIYRARMVVRDMKATGTTYYGHHLEGLDIKMPGAGGVGRETGSLDFTQTPDTIKIGHLLSGFKPHEDKHT